MPLMPDSQALESDSFANLLPQIRLIATDMDGTLTSEERFTPRLVQMLEQLAQREIPVIIVTGRSAGWVSAVVHYLPVVGAIAENGGLFFKGAQAAPVPLVPINDFAIHRQRLADFFRQLQKSLPQIHESTDNRYRLTDWTFDVAGLSQGQLDGLQATCDTAGWGFTYSTVQCHIKLQSQEKSAGLQQVMQQYFSTLAPDQVVTVGDSPNDESLFNAAKFPISVGVANITRYLDRFQHRPAYLTQATEVDGFCELAQRILEQNDG
ncbi:MAG: HAD family hydrolase [Cyanobacteria bacterium P01_A01_bin.123]